MSKIVIKPIEHPSKPRHADYERANLQRHIEQRGLKDAAHGLLTSGLAQPPQGSFSGWLWAMGELVMTLADQAVGGFIVADGSGKRYRMWGDSGPEWTEDMDAALHFTRRRDAEAFCANDEDAWHILAVSDLPETDNEIASTPGGIR